MAIKKTVTKTLPASNNLTLAQPRGMSQDEIEKLAIKVVSTMGSLCTKLKTLKPEIDAIKGFFNHHKRGEVLVMGCSSFEQFCTEKLGRTRQAVYFMLGAEKKEPRSADIGSEAAGAKPEAEKKDKARLLSIEQQERLIAVETIASRGLEARKKGKEVEAEQLDRELDILVHATPLDPVMRSYEPSYKALLLDLLAQCLLNNYESGAVKQHCEEIEEQLQGFKSKALDERELVEEVRATLSVGLSTAMAIIAIAKAEFPGCDVSDPKTYDEILATCCELHAEAHAETEGV